MSEQASSPEADAGGIEFDTIVSGTGIRFTTDDLEQLVGIIEWRPISEYMRDQGSTVILRGGADRWVLGYWGMPNPPITYEPGRYEFGADGGVTLVDTDTPPPEPPLTVDQSPFWRHAQDVDEGRPIGFDPSEFGRVSAEWIARLSED